MSNLRDMIDGENGLAVAAGGRGTMMKGGIGFIPGPRSSGNFGPSMMNINPSTTSVARPRFTAEKDVKLKKKKKFPHGIKRMKSESVAPGARMISQGKK